MTIRSPVSRDIIPNQGSRRSKKLIAIKESKIKCWVDENCTISSKAISNKCMQEFDVRICKLTAENILSRFSNIPKRIYIVHKRRSAPDTKISVGHTLLDILIF
ncbi:hypothetical protein HZS_2625 [Henneguya salminicola]|nr:hypothetical protein HZS_2625 [Henneguya salminicola]